MFRKPSLEPEGLLTYRDRPDKSGLLDGEQLPIVIYRNIQGATHEGVRHVYYS
ncbi:MAG TPA: hypothetical protein VLA60_03285 [Nitrospirales bacterium]|nr:hypothetical protein [Nitrospirales bacterium]